MNANIVVVFTFVAFATGAYVEVDDNLGVYHHPYVGNGVHDPDYYKEDLTVSKSHTVGQYPNYHGDQLHHHYGPSYYPHHQLQGWYDHGYYPHHHNYGGYGPYQNGIQKFLDHIYGYAHGYPHHYGSYQGYQGHHNYYGQHEYQKHQSYQDFANPLYAHLYGGHYYTY